MADRICANTTFAEVKSKLAAAVTGDRVLIPAGTVTFTSCIGSTDPFNIGEDTTLRNKAITIEGGYGGGETIFLDNLSKTPIYPERQYMLYWELIDAAPTTIRNITFQGGVISDPNNATTFILFGISSQFRMTNCKFRPTTTSMFTINGYVRGVVDHCRFMGTGPGVQYYVHHGGWNAVGSLGDNSWAQPHTLGSAQALFFEQNTYEGVLGVVLAACDGWQGQRVVYRYNQFFNMAWANHGTESGGRHRGARQCEIYENDFTFDGIRYPSAMGTRSGTGLFFNNRIVGVNQAPGTLPVDRAVDATNQRNDLGAPGETFWPWGWAGRWTPVSVTASGTSVTVTSPNRKGGSNYHGYTQVNNQYVQLAGFTPAAYNGTWLITALTNQTITFSVNTAPGGSPSVMGQCQAPWDGNTTDFGYPCLDQCGVGPSALISGDFPVPPVGGMQQTSIEPLYLFNNTINGSVSNLVMNGAGSAQIMQPGRDYFDNTMKPGYTPFTYPHPLNTEGGGAPPPLPPGKLVLKFS